MNRSISSRLLWCLWLLVFCAGPALAQPNDTADASDTPRGDPAASKTERPVYLDIIPVADARFSMLPEELVASLAREALSGSRQAVIRLADQTLPAGVRVLRIMYIVHQQDNEDGVTAAAAAATELLRTAEEADGGIQTFSIYNGLQQTLVQGADTTRAREQLREAFKRELQSRIESAFQNPDAS